MRSPTLPDKVSLQEQFLVTLTWCKDPGLVKYLEMGLFEGANREIAKGLIKHWEQYNEPPGDAIWSVFDKLVESEAWGTYKDLIISICEFKDKVHFPSTIDKVALFLDCQAQKDKLLLAVEAMQSPESWDTLDRVREILKEKRPVGELDKMYNATQCLAHNETTEFVVEKMLARSGVSLLVSQPKAGKSTIARALTMAVTRGKTFLGRQCEKGSAIYFSCEDPFPHVLDHYREMGLKKKDEIIVRPGPVPVNFVQLLRMECEKRKPDLVIIDTMTRAMEIRDENSYAAVAYALGEFVEVARDTGVHIMLLHHSRKAGGKGGAEALGSTAIFGSVDTLLSISRDGSQRSIYTVPRVGKAIAEPTAFELDGYEVTLGRTFFAMRMDEHKVKVLRYMQQEAKPLGVKEFRCGIADKLLRKTLKVLQDGAQVSVSGSGKRNDPFLYSVV